jgi:hypothetical protein
LATLMTPSFSIKFTELLKSTWIWNERRQFSKGTQTSFPGFHGGPQRTIARTFTLAFALTI